MSRTVFSDSDKNEMKISKFNLEFPLTSMTSKGHTENFQSLETFVLIGAKNGFGGQSFLGLAKTSRWW